MKFWRFSIMVVIIGMAVLPGPWAAQMFAAPLVPGERAGALLAVTAAETGGDWWTRAMGSVQLAEYQVTWQERTHLADVAAAYHAPNRAHNLRVYFTPGEVAVIPRTWADDAAAPPWRLNLSLSAWGGMPVGAAALYPDGHVVEYRRPGIVERYHNDARGLRQELVLSAPLSAGPLSLILDISGDLVPRRVGDDVELTAADGQPVLRYTDLRLVDATGRQLAAQLRVSGAELQAWTLELAGDAPAAVYPLTFSAVLSAATDGLATEVSWYTEGGQVGAFFGTAVDSAGDVNGDGYAEVIVGAPYYDNGDVDAGAAFIFFGSVDGLSTTPGWTVEFSQASAHFASAVAMAGDVNGDGFGDVIVSAPEFDDGQVDEGSVYAYYGSATGPSTAPDWMVEGDQDDAFLGSAIKAAGDVNGDGYADVIVGAELYDNSESNEGMVFVYHGSAGGLGLAPAWVANGGQINARFGSAVSTAGDVNGDGYYDVVVGAILYDAGESNEGAAFVYHGSATGLEVTPAWMMEGDQDFGYYGAAVGMAGDVNGDGYGDVLVGMTGYENGEISEGAAFLYYGASSGLDTSPAWVGESDQAGAQMGNQVSTAGDVDGDGYADLVIAAEQYDNELANEGRLFVYHGSSSGPAATPDWIVEGDQENCGFGTSTGLAGDVNGDGYSDIVVGSPRSNEGEDNEGMAYAFYGSTDGLQETANWTAEGDQDGAMMGAAVGTAGDVNGDGYADVIVGLPYYDNGQEDEGAAVVYHGSAWGLNTTADWMVEGDQAWAYMGLSVGSAGDVNGDGYGDVVVGADGYTDAYGDEGAAFVYHGSASGLSLTADWIGLGGQVAAAYGHSVATAGDVNGDGYGDVVVGAPGFDGGQLNEGAAFVYYGSAAGLSAIYDWMADGGQEGSLYGSVVGSAGDPNNDGYSEVIVGAPGYDNDDVDAGAAFGYWGSAAGLSTTRDWTVEGDQDGARLGAALGNAGDVNGDNYSDLVVGAPYYDDTYTDAGAVFIYRGWPGGIGIVPAWTAKGSQHSAHFGAAVTGLGDVNGDHYADTAVAAPGYDGTGPDRGRVYVFCGTRYDLDPDPCWMTDGEQDGAHFGQAVGTAGDVDGDGYADLVVGAPDASAGQSGEGVASVYYSVGAGNGLPYLPRQMFTAGARSISWLGMSDSTTSVQLQLNGRLPIGRGDVKLQWEVAPVGVPYTETVVISGTSAAWTTVVTPNVLLVEEVTGLAMGTSYHWRVRLLYRPNNLLGQQASRWIHVPWNSWAETDFRTPIPVAGLAAINNSPKPVGTLVALSAMVTEGNPVDYAWDLGDGTFGAGAQVYHAYAAPGVYTAIVTASNTVSSATTTTTVVVTSGGSFIYLPITVQDGP
ncbi:MAG: FG-GAP repeat protein [Anaerolineae bacterium]|nr:FG-GAP repeat protein [Anaerolineae bacterium]